jgi:protease-4
MDSLAASAAYLISLGAEHTFAQNGTITGSIGVIMEIPNLKEAADKLGIKFDYVRTSPIKGSPTMFEAKNERAFANLNDMMQDFYTYFVTTVATQRKIPMEKAHELADGRIFSGKGAVDNKLVDAVGNEADARKWLDDNKKISVDLKIEEVKLYKPKEPLEEFLGSLSENLGIKALADRIFNFKGLLL